MQLAVHIPVHRAVHMAVHTLYATHTVCKCPVEIDRPPPCPHSADSAIQTEMYVCGGMVC